MPHVLVVDSSAGDRRRVSRALSNLEGFTLHEVATLQEARIRLSVHPIDVVVCDTAVEDGEVSDLFSDTRPGRIPIVTVVAGTVQPAEVHSLAAQCAAVVSKAAVEDELAAAVERVFDAARAARMKAQAEAFLQRQIFEYELDNEKLRISHFVELLMQHCDRFDLFDERDRIRCQISMEEALLNSMIHGNLEVSSKLRELDGDVFEHKIQERIRIPFYANRRVLVRAELDRQQVRFLIRDEGPGFDVSKLPDPRDEDRLDVCSGRGVLLMRSFMNEVTYNDRGNQIVMWKARSASRHQTVGELAGCGSGGAVSAVAR
jgi:CheY-like chemotaxis protein